MKKYLLLAAVAMASASALMAAPITPSQALQRIAGNTPLKLASRNASSLQLVHTVTAESGMPAMYVFDCPSNQGYLILSADDVAAPVLGYADNGSFKLSEMPPQMEWWLSEYAASIANAPASATYSTRASNLPAIAPLLSTKWDQGAPYYNLCPKVNNTPCYTGCVATAMSQVMKHWNYPDRGTGYGSITLPTGATGDQSMNLRTTSFDWNNMLDTYVSGQYTNEQATAVATLMKATGYACNMSYSLYGSGALAMNAAMAFSNNFSYNSNIQYLKRDYFKSSDWENIVYTELAANRPIMYGGQSTSVGHEFVCDGYDGNGYFHFNWGWSGMSDGYFLLDALDPDAVGTGGGAGGGYNSGQDIIIGVQPTATDVPVYLTQWGSLSGTVTGATLSLNVKYNNGTGYWLNMGIKPITVNIAAEFQPADGGTPTYQTFKANQSIKALSLTGNNVSYSYTAGTGSVMFPAGLADGRYKVTVCYQNTAESNPAWRPVCTTPGAYNYIYVTKSGSSYTVENLDETELTIKSAEITSELYYQNACKIKIEVANESELEISDGFFPTLLSGSNEVMLAEGVRATLQPGETKTLEFTTTFELLSGASAPTRQTGTPYTLKFLKSPGSTVYYNYSTSVSMKILVGTISVTANELKVKDAPTKIVQIGSDMRTAYVASDASAIPFEGTITNNGTYFAKPVYTLIFNGDLTGSKLDYCIMGPTLCLSQGQSGTVNCSFDFSYAQTDTPYAMALFYEDTTGLQQIPTLISWFLIDPTSGVEDITADSETVSYDRASATVTAAGEFVSLEIYDINGTKLAATSGYGNLTVSLAESGKGMAVVVARKANGETITKKIIRN